MIEAGFVSFIQTGIASAFPLVSGGYGTQLPENALSASVPQLWTWRTLGSTPTYTLTGQVSMTKWLVSIDCHGYQSKALAITLARAIDGVLRGVPRLTLSDPDNTIVDSIFKTGAETDGYSDINRSHVITVDYRVFYYQQ